LQEEQQEEEQRKKLEEQQEDDAKNKGIYSLVIKLDRDFSIEIRKLDYYFTNSLVTFLIFSPLF
jgi:uncharacterized protein involved in cysteine biosynthesis